MIVANQLNVFVSEEQLFGGDVTKVVDIMDTIVQTNDTTDKVNLTEVICMVFITVSFLHFFRVFSSDFLFYAEIS